jgi:hypothetical protein
MERPILALLHLLLDVAVDAPHEVLLLLYYLPVPHGEVEARTSNYDRSTFSNSGSYLLPSEGY